MQLFINPTSNTLLFLIFLLLQNIDNIKVTILTIFKCAFQWH